MIIGTTLIVLSWVLLIKLIPLWACIVLTVLGGILCLFGLLFGVYFFNLDMKFMAKISGPLSKIYDKRKKNRKI